MIVITGDVHHMSMKGADQQYLKQTEPQITEEYIDIITSYDLKVTLFVTGKAIEEEPDVFHRISKNPLVEFGGHNYYTFQPKWLYGGVFGKLMGSNCGPKPFQNWEIKKTINKFRDVLDIDIVSWRDHGYRHDNNTYLLLAKNGIKVVSDEVGPGFKRYRTKEGIISLPVNTPPDHDHLFHAGLTEKKAENYKLINNKFEVGLINSEQWLDMLFQQFEANIKNDIISTFLLHPACMKILDDFKTLKKICSNLKSYNSLKISDVD